MRVMLVRALAGRRRAGPALMGSTVSGIRFVVMMPGLAVVVMLMASVAMTVVFAVMVSGRFGMTGVIRQFADFVAFAGPEKDKSGGRQNGGRVAEDRAHRRHSRHRL